MRSRLDYECQICNPKKAKEKLFSPVSYGRTVGVMDAGLLKLFGEGDSTIPARLILLKNQMEVLENQKASIEETMSRLSYKIERYEEAVKTGVLSWPAKDKEDF